MNTLEAYEERVLNKVPEQRKKTNSRGCRLSIRILVLLLTGITAFLLVYVFIPAVAYGESLSIRCFVAALTFAVMLDFLYHEFNHVGN